MRSALLASIVVVLVSFSCTPKETKLPIFGEREFDGKDTIYHTIAPFQFVNQDSAIVNNATFLGKVYVADFFFTSCRTICPIMKTQMHRVYEQMKDRKDLLILSHTIDPQYDDVKRLHDYAEMLEVKSDRWHFVTGSMDSIYKIAQTSYFATAKVDKTEPDGFIHSGAFLLIDRKQRIRGKYDGTKPEDVDRMMKDIDILLKENEQ